jgi:hypothetical protein
MAPSKATKGGNHEGDSRHTKKKKADRGVHLEPMRTTDYTKGQVEYNKTFVVLEKLIARLKRLGHPQKWKKDLESPYCLRVVQRTLSTMDKHPGLMLEKSTTHSLTTTPSMEISRCWEIHLRDPNLNTW